MRPHLTVEQRQLALRLKAKGLSLRETGPQAGCTHQGAALILALPLGGRPATMGGRLDQDG